MNDRGVTGLEIAGVIFLLGLSAKVMCRLVTTEWDCGAERRKNPFAYEVPSKHKIFPVNEIDFKEAIDDAKKETDSELIVKDH